MHAQLHWYTHIQLYEQMLRTKTTAAYPRNWDNDNNIKDMIDEHRQSAVLKAVGGY